MKPPIPMVKIANNADALRIWRPNGETGAVNAVNHTQLRAKFFVNAPLVAFAKQKQSDSPSSAEMKRNRASGGLAVMIGNDQIVGIDAIDRFCNTLEQTALMNALQFELGCPFHERLDFNPCGVRQQRADNEAGMIASGCIPSRV